MNWLDGQAILRRLRGRPAGRGAPGLCQGAVPRLVQALLPLRGDPWRPASGQLPGPAGPQGINLLDFGAIRVFPPSFVGGVILLYEAVRDHDEDKAAEAYRIWGFRDLSKDTMEVLSLWAKFLYEPLVQDRVRPIQESDDMSYGRKVAAKVHEGLKRTGGVRVPREFPLMDRAAIGLGSVFLRLRADINWHRMFMELVEDFETGLAERQAAGLREAGVPVAMAGGGTVK